MPLLEIEDLSSGYNGVPVVRNLDLHVDEGEVVALLGPNGAGKTTTLLTVSALNPILVGRRQGVRPVGQGTAPAPGRPRGPGPRPRGPRAVLPADRARRTCASARRAAPPTSTRRSATSRRWQKLMDRKAGLLSGGEQQMLAMARALTVEAEAVDGRRDEPRPRADHRRAAAARPAADRRRHRRRRPARRAARPPRARRSPTGPTC